jgi:predicted O-methyltransferase YrrM
MGAIMPLMTPWITPWITPWMLTGMLSLSTGGFAVHWWRTRLRLKRLTGAVRYPVASVELASLDDLFTVGPYGPTLDAEVAFIGRGPLMVPGGTSDGEAWILAVLAKRARALFEFGTCTGKTAYLWARNAPIDAHIVTLTLAPAASGAYQHGAADAAEDARYAIAESAFDRFLYSGTTAEPRITQLYADSKAFDESPYVDWADVVFVDGSHARSYVDSDSAKAMRIVKPGGLVIWHDYAGDHHAPGVYHALNALARELPLRHVKGTTFVVWRRPVG